MSREKKSSDECLFTQSFLFILSANFLLYFGFWLLVPILPYYLKDTYKLGEASVGVILSCYTISALCARPFMGYLYNEFARKLIYIIAYVAFTAVFIGYIPTVALFVFVLLRIVHGIAFGTVTVGGNTLVIDIIPSARRGEALGYYGLTNNIAMSIGPMMGLFLQEMNFDYEHIFGFGLISCMVGLTCALAVRVPRKELVRHQPISLDRFILVKGIPAGIVLMMLSIPYGATTNYVAVYAKTIDLNVPTGFFFTFMAVGMGVSRIFSGKFVDRGYITQTISYGFYIVATAFLMLAFCSYIVDVNEILCAILFYLESFMLGSGFGVMFPAYNTLYINLAPNNQRATATSTYLTSWDVGIGLGIWSGGIIAEHISYYAVYLFGSFLCVASMLLFNIYVAPHFHKNKVR